jgi:hypothetical protein
MIKYEHYLMAYMELSRDIQHQFEAVTKFPIVSAMEQAAKQFRQFEIFQLDQARLLAASDLGLTAAVTHSRLIETSDWLSVVDRLASVSGSALASSVRLQEEIGKSALLLKIPNLEIDSLVSDHVTRALAGIDAARALYGLGEPALKAAALVPVSFQAFVARQLQEASRASRIVAARRVDLSVLAAELLDGAQAVFRGSAVLPTRRADGEPVPIPPNVFRSLETELSHVFTEEFDGEVSDAYSLAVTTRVATAGAALVQLVVRINHATERRGDPPVFKPTTTAMQACSILPSAVAKDEDLLSKVVDQLWFLIYEGSGEAKRLLDILTDAELEDLWNLKQLRLSYRHDVDHGDQVDVQRKHAKIGAAFESVLGEPVILSDADCPRAQLALYDRLIRVLERVLEALATQEGD